MFIGFYINIVFEFMSRRGVIVLVATIGAIPFELISVTIGVGLTVLVDFFEFFFKFFMYPPHIITGRE